MKKLFCLFLCLLVVCSVFVGCNDGSTDETESYHIAQKPDISGLKSDMDFVDEGSGYELPFEKGEEVYSSDLISLSYEGIKTIDMPLADEEGNFPAVDKDGNYVDAENFEFAHSLSFAFSGKSLKYSSTYLSVDSIIINGFSLPSTVFVELTTDGSDFAVSIPDGYLKSVGCETIESFSLFGSLSSEEDGFYEGNIVFDIIGDVPSVDNFVSFDETGTSLYESDSKLVKFLYVGSGKGTTNRNNSDGSYDFSSHNVLAFYVSNNSDTVFNIGSASVWFNGVLEEGNVQNKVIAPHTSGYVILSKAVGDAEAGVDDDFDDVTVSFEFTSEADTHCVEPTRII